MDGLCKKMSTRFLAILTYCILIVRNFKLNQVATLGI